MTHMQVHIPHSPFSLFLYRAADEVVQPGVHLVLTGLSPSVSAADIHRCDEHTYKADI